MFMHIRLTRPPAILDLEATSKHAKEARIVDISILKFLPDGSKDRRPHRINPGIPIPTGATEIHDITDADVADAPPFDGCDLWITEERKAVEEAPRKWVGVLVTLLLVLAPIVVSLVIQAILGRPPSTEDLHVGYGCW